MVLNLLRVQIDPYIILPQLVQYLFKPEVITKNKSHTESLLEQRFIVLCNIPLMLL